MTLIKPLEWANFITSQRAAHSTFYTHSITWLRRKGNGRDRFGEDLPEEFSEVILPCQKNYNVMRTWPITEYTESGENDRQSVQVWFSKPLLKEKGYITSEQFSYNPSTDLFKIGGVIYKAQGDTPASQVYEDDLIFTIILRPVNTKTGP